MKNKAVSMFYWIKNKKAIEEEHQKEDDQYNQQCIEINNLHKEIENLKNQLKNEINLKKIYLSRCKSLKRKLAEHENKTS